MSEWTKINLGQLAIKIGSGATPRGGSNAYKDSGISLIRSQNILDFKFSVDGLAFIDDEQAEALKNVEVLENDVLLNITGDSVARCCLAPRSVLPARVNQHVAIVRLAPKKADHSFIFYLLQSMKEELLMRSEIGATRRALTKEMIENLDLLLPELPEQKSIAAVLSSFDDKIDLLHRQNATLEALAETIFRQLFIIEAKGNWEERPLRSVVDIGIGRTPPREQNQWFSPDSNNIKWISIKDMGNDGVYLFQTAEHLTPAAVEQFNIPLIPKDTVVLSFKMTVGRVAITSEAMLSNEAIAHFKFNPKTPFTKEYLYLFLKNFKYDILGSTSSIVTSINSTMIKDMEISVPDERTKKEFERESVPLFFKIRSNQLQIKTLERLRDTLLPKLMSGEVRVES